MSIPIRWFLAPVLLTAPALPAAEPALTGQARAFLARYCQRCHDGGGARGGFDFVLDRDRLVGRGLVVPGKPDASLLYERVSQGEMPPAGKSPRPAAQEVALLREWIAAGAPWPSSPRPAGLTLAGLHRLIRDDLSAVPARQRRFVRYVTFSHLASAGRSAEEMAEYGRALAKLVNAPSWHPRTSRPPPADPPRAVFRLALRADRWPARTWDRLVVASPSPTAPADTDARWSAAATGAATYYLKGDWLIATASRGQLYYDVLEVPSTDRA